MLASSHSSLPPTIPSPQRTAQAPDAQPLAIGYLEIVSNVELRVTAVYTASDPKANGLSMDVETVQPRLK